jgi:hypothetical protein
MFVVRAILACLLCFPLLLTGAKAAPAALKGISVELSWTDNRMEKFLDTGKIQSGYQISQVQLYISEQGRFFSQFNRKARGRGNRLQNSAVSGQGKSVLHWRFEGRSVVADQKFNGSGARRIAISFSDDASSCTVRVIHGKSNGAPVRYPGLTSHRPIELVSIEVTGTSCQVQKGNIFGH